MDSRRPHPLLSIVSALLVLALDAALLALGLGDPAMLVRDPRALVLLVVWGVAEIVNDEARARAASGPRHMTPFRPPRRR